MMTATQASGTMDGVDRTAQPPTPRSVRTIDDVETLKALSDPTRLAILRTLMSGAEGAPPVMSVKELAGELGEPQTKLYRHVKLLETRGLIEVAQTRVVSGILEQRYRASQVDLTIDRALITRADPDDRAAVVAALFDTVRNQVVAGLRSGQLGPDDQTPPAGARRLRTVFGSWQNTIAPAKAQEYADRLTALLNEISQTEHDEHGIPVLVFATIYSPPDPPASQPDPPASR
jgi:DNA-binding transcriptional ArsR family regulator